MEDILEYGQSDDTQVDFDPSILDKDYGGRVDWDRVFSIASQVRQNQAYKERQNAARKKAEMEAVRYSGMSEFDSLVKAGLEPMEAFRRTGSKMFHGDPEGFLKFQMDNIIPRPSVEEIDGEQFANFGGRWQRLPPRKDPLADLDRYMAKRDYEASMKAFTESKKPIKDKDGNPVEDHVKVAETARKARLSEEALRKATAPKNPLVSATPTSESKKITKEIALEFLKQAKGDREAARKLAKESGYSF